MTSSHIHCVLAVLLLPICIAGAAFADPKAAAPGFSVADFGRFGVTLATAGPGDVDIGIELPGEVRPDADRTAHVAPRFPGQVREVRAAVGDSVRGGDVLATIESDTLASFPLRAPFDGVVVDKHIVAGETVRPDAPAFIITDLRTVWVDVNVYQKDLPIVRVGEVVRISAGGNVAEATGNVSYVSPVLDQATRTTIARVVLPNPNGAWRPGLFVTAHILAPVAVPVLAPRTALHQLDGRDVVFVAEGERFVPRPVRLGRRGRTTQEILAGLAVGERVAADNSFLVKAELGKGAAESE